MKSKPISYQNQSKSAIFNQFELKIDEKWDKNKNNGFGLGPQNLIIKSTQIGQFPEKINEN